MTGDGFSARVWQGSRRWLAPLLAASVVLGACSTSDDDAPPASAPVDTTLLRVGAQADSFTVDPPNRANVSTFSAHGSVIETLAVPAPDLSIRPLLASSWTFTAPATWRFQLRPGITFHNGAAFDAAAVAATFNGRLAGSFVVGLKAGATKAIDASTVEVVTDPPNSRLIYQLAHPQAGIVAPGTHPGVGTSSENTPTGTGPYRFASYTPKTELRVKRNDTYWGPKPVYEEMLFKFIPDSNSRVLALKAGDVDAIYDVPREQVAQLERDPSVAVVKSVTGAHQSLTLNIRGEAPYNILRDIEVRKAIAHGIAAEPIVKNVWPEGAEVTRSLIPPTLLGSHSSLVKGYAHDPERARTMLDAAGWRVGSDGVRVKDGRRLVLTMQVLLPDEQRPLPELVKDQLAQIGVGVDIKVPADSSAYFATVGRGEGDIFSEGSAAGIEHPLGPGTFFRSGPTSYGKWMAPGAAYDALYAQAFSASSEDEFRRLSAQMMKMLVDDEVVLIPIAGIFRIYGLSPKLQGLEPATFIYSQRWHTIAPKA